MATLVSYYSKKTFNDGNIKKCTLILKVNSAPAGVAIGDLNKLIESSKEARKVATAKAEEAAEVIEKAKEASDDFKKKQEKYFQALVTKNSLEREKEAAIAAFEEANRTKTDKESAKNKAPVDAVKTREFEAAKTEFERIEKEIKVIEEEIKNASLEIKNAEAEYNSAKTKADDIVNKADKITKEATDAEAHANQIESNVLIASLLSSSSAVGSNGLNDTKVSSTTASPTLTTAKPNFVALTPEQKLFIRLYFSKLKPEATTKPPTMVGNFIRAWAKVNLGIAESLDRVI